MFLLIPYDISDDKRRREVDKILSSYGKRVNYSVFEVEVNASAFRKLIKALEAVTVEQDHIRIYTLTKDEIRRVMSLALSYIGKNHKNWIEKLISCAYEKMAMQKPYKTKREGDCRSSYQSNQKNFASQQKKYHLYLSDK